MTAPAQLPAGLEQELQGILGKYGMALPPPAPAAAGSWAPPAPGWGQATHQGPPPIAGVAIPIKVQTPAGGIRIYLSVGPEAAKDGQTLLATLEALHSAGLPLDLWQDRNQWGGGGNGWRGNGGGRGWSGNGGGWRR